jgi:prevent-host-death family protein
LQIPVSEAKGQLTDLVRRAEAGEDVVLTRHGHPAVRLMPVRERPDRASRRKLLEAVRAAAAGKALLGPAVEMGAAPSQDFLYDESGLPR